MLVLRRSCCCELWKTWQVLAAAAVTGVVMAIDGPVRAAFVAEMVGTERLGNAISLHSSAFHLGGLVGPSISGALIATIGSGLAIALNALATTGAVLALLAMRTGELLPAPRVPRGAARSWWRPDTPSTPEPFFGRSSCWRPSPCSG